MQRGFAIVAAVIACASAAVAQPGRVDNACGGSDHGARARAERAFRAAVKAKKLTRLTRPLGEIVTWDHTPAARPGAIVEIDHQQVLVLGDGDEDTPPPAELVRDRGARIWLVARALEPTSTVTVLRCGCAHGGAAQRRLRYGVVVPDGVKVGGLMTIAYRGPAVIEQEPVACASRP